jgi:hypothetical protein
MVDVDGKTISSVELLYIAMSVILVELFTKISPVYIQRPPACESKGDKANPTIGVGLSGPIRKIIGVVKSSLHGIFAVI